jgi:pimeloyl-ACP methyl ester carboxylesterase
MSTANLSAGAIDYVDTGGGGPVVVLMHGLVMNGSVWRHVVGHLRRDHRVLVPTLPFGGHARPMHAAADLSPRGIGDLEAEFLDVLALQDVTLVGNDQGSFLFAAAARPNRVARLVITSCEAFENFPPGLPGKTVALAAKLPGGINAAFQPLRIRRLRRLALAFGRMSVRPVSYEVSDGWLHPLFTQRRVRRDLAKYLRSAHKGDMIAAAEGLRSFDRPALVVWAMEDRVMPAEHGRRFANLLPEAHLIEVPDSSTLIPEDQPIVLAEAIRRFVREPRPTPTRTG